MDENIEKLILFLQKEIVQSGTVYKLESITAPAFELFLEMSPKMDFSKLDEPTFRKQFLEKLRPKIYSEKYGDHVTESDRDGNGRIDTGGEGKITGSIDPAFQPISTPLDMEGDNPDRALKLIDQFFDLPFIEKEAYKIRILRKSYRLQIQHFHQQIKFIMKEEDLTEKTKKNHQEIKKLEDNIQALEEELQSLSSLQDFISDYGILTLQRRAFVRVRAQWTRLKNKLNEELMKIAERYGEV